MKKFLCCVKSGHNYTEFFKSPAGRSRAAYSAQKCSTKWLRKAGRYGILLSNLTEEIFSLLFADDVALVSHAPVGLQNKLNVLARASAKIGQVNLDKTKVMVFRKGGTLQRTKNGS